MNELFELGRKFLKDIKPSDRVLIVYHNDIDGICSGTLFLEASRKLGIENQVKSMKGMIEEPEKIFERMKGFDKIIIVDIAIDHLHKQLRQSKKQMLLIDHHPPFTDMNNEKIVHINPHFEGDVYQPTTYITYKLLSGIVNLKNKEWIAVLGTLGDYGLEDCRDLVEKYVKIKKDTEIWGTDFGKAAIIIGGASLELGTEKIVDVLLKFDGLGDVTKNKPIIEAYEKYKKEFERCEKEFEKNKEMFEEFKMIFSTIKPKYKRVGSGIATQLGTNNPDKIIMLLEKIDGKYKIHARYHDGKVHLGELMRKCCEGLDGGGGHKGAAGGIIDVKDIGIFKEKLIKELSKNLK